MAIEKFIVGHYYKYVGDPNFHENWNEHMDKWKDGVPRKCIKISTDSGRVYQECEFENIGGDMHWCYRRTSGHFDLFEEVSIDAGKVPEDDFVGNPIPKISLPYIPTENDIRKRVLSCL